MNPLSQIVAAVLLAGTFTAGWVANGWRIHADERRVDVAAQKAGQAATEAAVAAIKDLQPKFTTITKGIEREIVTKTVYRDCVHSDDAWGLLDSAYQAAGGQSFSDRAGVPAAATTP